MPTPLTRAIVSLAAATTTTLAAGACARNPSPVTRGVPTAADGRPLAVRFDNDARVHAHVYLVGERREWLLGRVEPGARATLRIPASAHAESSGFVRLAVLTGERVTLQAARSARAAVTLPQPASAILSQRWTFANGQLTQRQLPGPGLGHP